MTEEKKPYLSISQLSMLSKCGEQYRRRYIEGEILPPAVAMLVGRGVDTSVDSNLTSKVRTRELLPLEEVKDIARDNITIQWETSSIKFNEAEIELGIPKVKGEATDKAVRLASLHARERAPHIDPKEEKNIQRRWRIELEGFPRDLVGIIDIVEPPSDNLPVSLDLSNSKIVRPPHSVIDTKTAAKTPPKAIAHQSQQLTAYALAIRVEEGEIPVVTLDYLIDTKTPKSAVFHSTRGQDDFNALLRRVENAIEALDKGVFIPAQPTDWWCDKKWCGYYESCPYVNAEPVQIQV